MGGKKVGVRSWRATRLGSAGRQAGSPSSATGSPPWRRAWTIWSRTARASSRADSAPWLVSSPTPAAARGSSESASRFHLLSSSVRLSRVRSGADVRDSCCAIGPPDGERWRTTWVTTGDQGRDAARSTSIMRHRRGSRRRNPNIVRLSRPAWSPLEGRGLMIGVERGRAGSGHGRLK